MTACELTDSLETNVGSLAANIDDLESKSQIGMDSYDVHRSRPFEKLVNSLLMTF